MDRGGWSRGGGGVALPDLQPLDTHTRLGALLGVWGMVASAMLGQVSAHPQRAMVLS